MKTLRFHLIVIEPSALEPSHLFNRHKYIFRTVLFYRGSAKHVVGLREF